MDEVSPVVASEEGDELTTPADSNPPSVPTTKSESKRRNSRKRAEGETSLSKGSIYEAEMVGR